MRINMIVIVLAIAGISSMAQADTCPAVSKIKKNGEAFMAEDESGRKWEGENPMLTSINENETVFESATYITEVENETGDSYEVRQMSCRYKNIALVLDKVNDWKPTSKAWKSNNCTKSISECSFSMSNK